ncbi:arginase family protein [Microbacterium pygmaeum]|uniref:Arginase n=1 Tax=Microbacterium pygmaeum TaxID=370764 RepID=A0A1G8CEI5_9MICO|nr:arginase family protein [Microbacterium pygmaeum]SDH43894.1 arginase [Microbacterium pygmaeum]
MTRFVVAPQWQGSSSSRAMQLIDGALAIAGDLPRSATTILDVPAEAGESLGSGIRRLSSLTRVRAAIEEAIGLGDDPAIVVGGDCGVALAGVAAVAAEDLAVVWFDAHADLNTTDTSPSGAFHGMVLRAILGDGVDGMVVPTGRVSADRLILAGTRELDLEEELYISATGIRVLPPAELADPEVLAEAVAATGAARVYIHVDLDVLDPGEIGALTHPVPFGLTPAELVAAIRAVRGRLPLAGASLTEFSPASAEAAVDDLGAILRVVGALA